MRSLKSFAQYGWASRYLDAIQAIPWRIYLLWFLIGLSIGSFLNVCIYRMPREQSIVRPRSRCVSCEHPIAWFENIPILSFIFLLGKCRHCGEPISLRYPLVEFITAIATVSIFARFGISIVSVVYLAFVCALIVASFIDIDFQIIPDEISLGGLAAGLILSFLFPTLHGTDFRLVALSRSVLGAIAGGGLLYLTGIFGNVVFRKESMGGGDIKLLAMAGSLIGWKLVTLTFFTAPVFALVPGLLVLIFKRSHVIPYGPFLSIGLIVSLFVGNDLLQASGIEDTFRLLWSYYGWAH